MDNGFADGSLSPKKVGGRFRVMVVRVMGPGLGAKGGRV